MFSSNNSQVSNDAVFVEDIFSTYLYTGNDSAQTITNNIDLSTKGGMVWWKSRSNVSSNLVQDTTRGINKVLRTNTTDAETTETDYVTAVSTTGFSVGASLSVSPRTYATWTFRKQPKFFDVVTYTGTGSVQNISHNLGSAPACMIVKDTTNAGSAWAIYHTSLGNTQYLQFTTSAAGTSSGYWNNTSPTSTQFTVGTNGNVNQSGATYVAYLFAHNAGGFGLTGTDNVISCGSFTSSSIGLATVDLGYEPQWILYKGSNGVTNWQMVDNMRGFVVGAANAGTSYLNANTSGAEATTPPVGITNTGFNFDGAANITYIYIAIRRGPMKVPTSGTSVFQPLSFNSSASNQTINPGITTDLCLLNFRNIANGFEWFDRLRGITGTTGSGNPMLTSVATQAEANSTEINGAGQTTLVAGGTLGGYTQIVECFRRAPSFFDEVCYTGTGTNTTQTHNLGVVPEMIIVKKRSVAADWEVYQAALGATNIIELNLTGATSVSATRWNNTAPTSSVFSLGTHTTVNASGATYVAYLFATCAGVSKCTAFTGTGTLQSINCGFTAGSRFVLIKRTDAAGDWYVWDSARGLSSSTDPYLLLNSTAAEVTSTNWVDTTSTGFQVTAASGNNVNINGASYIALAIA